MPTESAASLAITRAAERIAERCHWLSWESCCDMAEADARDAELADDWDNDDITTCEASYARDAEADADADARDRLALAVRGLSGATPDRRAAFKAAYRWDGYNYVRRAASDAEAEYVAHRDGLAEGGC